MEKPAALQLLQNLYKYKQILIATTRFELKKRYAGTFGGLVWFFLYPLLFLSVYLFLYLIVFKVQYPTLNTMQSVIYIFSGLVPYIAFMEVANTSTTCIKQNIHLVKNVILPVEFIPLRNVIIAICAQVVGFGMIILLALIDHSISFNIFYLFLAILLETLFLLGLALFVAPLGLLLPDLSYFINILTLLLLFLSPIGFMTAMLGGGHLELVVNLNPVNYLIAPFRMAFIQADLYSWKVLTMSIFQSVFVFIAGIVFFEKFKLYSADYE